MTELEMVVVPHEYQTLSYRGYELERVSHVDDNELKLLRASCWLVNNKATIRETAENCDFAKSTLHEKIHKELRYLSPDLYREVIHQMKENMKRWGGEIIMDGVFKNNMTDKNTFHSCKFKDTCPIYDKTAIPCSGIFKDQITKCVEYEQYCIPGILKNTNKRR